MASHAARRARELGPIIVIKSHITPDDPNNPSTLDEMIRNLRILGADVRVISCDSFAPVQSYPLEVMRWIPRSLFGLFSSACAISKLAIIASVIMYHKNRINPSMVVVEELSYIIPLLKLFSGIKMIYYEDVLRDLPAVNHLSHYRSRNRHHQLFYFKFVEKIIVSSNVSEVLLRCLNVRKHPILLYPNIHTAHFLDAQTVPPDAIFNFLHTNSILIVLLIGDYSPEANAQIAINAFERILKVFLPIEHIYRNLLMFICGTTKTKQHERYMDDLMGENVTIPRIIYIRNFAQTFKLALMKHAKCILFTNTTINHDQMLIMSSMMMGKIILATECESINEFIIHGHNGYICKATAKSFAKYMLKVIVQREKHRGMSENIEEIFVTYFGEERYKLSLESIFIHDSYPPPCDYFMNYAYGYPLDDYEMYESPDTRFTYDNLTATLPIPNLPSTSQGPSVNIDLDQSSTSGIKPFPDYGGNMNREEEVDQTESERQDSDKDMSASTRSDQNVSGSDFSEQDVPDLPWDDQIVSESDNENIYTTSEINDSNKTPENVRTPNGDESNKENLYDPREKVDARKFKEE